jgi:hypothetical protein
MTDKRNQTGKKEITEIIEEEIEKKAEEKTEENKPEEEGTDTLTLEQQEMEEEDLKEEEEEEDEHETNLQKIAKELGELIINSGWNQDAYKYATTVDPESQELVRTRLLLIEPRSVKQLEDDGGFHFDWIEDFLIPKANISNPGVVLILFRNDSKNTLQSYVEACLQKEKKWKINCRVIIKDKNPRANAVARTKHFNFTSAKQLMYVVTYAGVKVSFS